jgi:hypothetical protein
MAKSKHKDKALVNIKTGEHSTLTLVDVVSASFDLTGWDVSSPVTDDLQKGEWNAHRSKSGDQKTELRLLLTCTTPPSVILIDPPDTGTLTITLTKPMTTATTTQTDVDYVNEAPP